MKGEKEPTLPPYPRTGMITIIPVLSPIHTMDILSVRCPPVPVMVPADRVSTHNMPLAETLSVAERELFLTISYIGPRSS